jgi:hypothetical protein
MFMADLSTVYVLTNPAIPKLVKIGRTSDRDVNARIAELFTTGVPVPFKLEYACKVINPAEVEKALHIAFAPNRVNPRREFFEIEPEQAIAILKLLHTQDSTQEVAAQPVTVDQESLAAAERLRKRRLNLNFDEMQIPLGSQLTFADSVAFVTIVGPRKVCLGDQDMSLTAATRKLLQLDYDVAPGSYWSYNGRLLRDIYEETYGEVE